MNTASPALLAYVPGIGEKLAQNIVAYRDAHGAFNSRKELKKVAGMGNRAFEQSVGFLRIYGGKEPLDGSAIHPENYKTAKEILKLANITMGMPVKEKRKRIDQMLKNHFSLDELAELLEVGKPTLTDILEQLVQPGRDPRQDLPKPVLRSGILTLEELQPGMTFQGTVRNVTDFGAFIDIGLKSDALLHKSRFPQGKALKVGDVVQAEVETVDKERERVGLTM